MSAARLLHPTQRTNADVSPNVCVGPEADILPDSLLGFRAGSQVQRNFRFGLRSREASALFELPSLASAHNLIAENHRIIKRPEASENQTKFIALVTIKRDIMH
jgi:hypothetical protein